MSAAEDLMQRLAVSKKIMDRQSSIKRGDLPQHINTTPMLESFETPQATYNLPQEFLSEQPQTQRSNFDPTKPIEQTKILNSKLPDEIKKLMIEQPIVQPNSMGSTTISNDIIEGAQRLMKMDKPNMVQDNVTAQPKTQQKQQPTTNTSFNMNEMKTMIRDVIRDTVRDVIREELQEAGILSESTENANEVIQFKVGKHIFMGKVTKIQKLK